MTQFIWSTMEKMDVAATTPGPHELEHWPLLKQFIAAGTVPVISSNLTYQENGVEKPLGEPYRIVTENGLKVALFGLIGGNQFSTARLPQDADISFKDPTLVATDLVPKLRKQADIVVLMSEMSTQDTDRLVADIPGIDVALYGNLPPWVPRAEKIKDTIVNKTGARGQYLGELILIVDPAGKIIDFGSENAQLNEAFPEDPDIANQVSDLEAEETRIRDQRRGQTTEQSQRLSH